ncbi:MAG: response regulator [Deltaproteobacteria bacterium]|nr:response regulator [Deltaproteobacteria bacterium]
MADIDGQFTLLLVDDNPTNLTLLVKIIELDLPQVRVLTATNAVDGLQLTAREQIDGAFIDVQMPQMSGLEMCRRLKADPRTAGIPLVLITAHLAAPEMRAEGLEVGAYDFISQPISNIEMLARIKVMLRLCQGEQRHRREALQLSQPDEEHLLRLRWISGLLLSGDGPLVTPDPLLLRELAADLSAADELDEQQLIIQLGGRFPLPWRRSFLKLALLDTIPLALAVKLSEVNDIEAVFDYLRRHNLVLAPAPAGETAVSFKPSVRELLRGWVAQTLTAEEQQQVYLCAADWYQQKNELTSAFRCLLRAEQYAGISQLFSQSGLALLDESRHPQVMQLLSLVPEEEAVRCGWLSLFTGVSCMRSRPLDVDTWLELARARFVANADQRGELLTLSQQIIQYLVVDGQFELGLNRLTRLRQLVATQLDLLAPYNRIKVLFVQGLAELFYAGSLSACEELLARAMPEALREKLFELQLDLSLLQVLLSLFQGRLRVARAAMEQARVTAVRLPDTSLPVQVFQMVACKLLHVRGELQAFSQQRHSARQGWGAEELQQSAFGPQLNFFSGLADLAQGNFAAAEELLNVTLVESPAAARPHLKSWLLQLRGLLHAYAGRNEAAQADCDTGLALRHRIGNGLGGLPNLLLAGATAVVLQQYPQAGELLREGLTTSVELGEERYRGGFHAWLAQLSIACGEDSAARQQLEALFEQLRRQQNNFFFALTPDLIRSLAAPASSRTDWSAQLQRLTRRWLDCGVTDDGRLVPLAHLQTLGGFRYQLAGRSLNLSEVGQTSRQLLALLSVAPNCSLSPELLMGILWPESPSGKARNSFDTALLRLRKALEGCFGKQIRQDYLVLEKGMLLLRNLRIDSSEFVQALELSRRHLQRQNLWQAELAFWQAERLWSGEFLTGYELDADLPYKRDQFNQLRLEQLEGLARLLLLRGDSTEAVRLLQSGLQIDPTHDVLVGHLLDIYQRQHDIRAVRQLLDSYRSALQDEDYDQGEIDELITALGPQRLEF